MKKLLFIIALFLCIPIYAKKIYKCNYMIVAPIDTVHIKGTLYTDTIISLNFSLNESSLGVTIANKSAQPMFIDWEQCAMVINGISERCIHSGIKYIEKANPQPRTIIAPSAILSDVLSPVSYITWLDRSYLSLPSMWNIMPIVALSTTSGNHNYKFTEEAILAQENKEITIMLCIIIEEKPVYKTFTIRCFNFKQSK